MNIENVIFESQKRYHWFIDGLGLHGLDWELFIKIPTERLVELYNVEMKYFRKK